MKYAKPGFTMFRFFFNPLNIRSTKNTILPLLPCPHPRRLSSHDTNSVVGVLMDFLNGDGAMDVILFVRSIVEQYEVGDFFVFISGTLFSRKRGKYTAVWCVLLNLMISQCPVN